MIWTNTPIRTRGLTGIALTFLGSMAVWSCNYPTQSDRGMSDLDKKCANVAEQKRKDLVAYAHDDLLYKRTAFHSRRLGTCVEGSEKEVGNDFQIVDVSRDFFRADPLDHDQDPFGLLFSCGPDGVNNLRIELAEQYRGYLSRAPLMMDDYEGGPPAIIKSPSKPVTRERCEALYTRKLDELR